MTWVKCLCTYTLPRIFVCFFLVLSCLGFQETNLTCSWLVVVQGFVFICTEKGLKSLNVFSLLYELHFEMSSDCNHITVFYSLLSFLFLFVMVLLVLQPALVTDHSLQSETFGHVVKPKLLYASFAEMQ